jgi:hypothetical protein
LLLGPSKTCITLSQCDLDLFPGHPSDTSAFSHPREQIDGCPFLSRRVGDNRRCSQRPNWACLCQSTHSDTGDWGRLSSNGTSCTRSSAGRMEALFPVLFNLSESDCYHLTIKCSHLSTYRHTCLISLFDHRCYCQSLSIPLLSSLLIDLCSCDRMRGTFTCLLRLK